MSGCPYPPTSGRTISLSRGRWVPRWRINPGSKSGVSHPVTKAQESGTDSSNQEKARAKPATGPAKTSSSRRISTPSPRKGGKSCNGDATTTIRPPPIPSRTRQMTCSRSVFPPSERSALSVPMRCERPPQRTTPQRGEPSKGGRASCWERREWDTEAAILRGISQGYSPNLTPFCG